MIRLGRQFSDATIFMHEALANRAGLSLSDHKYLSYLLLQGPATAGELARLTGLTTGAVTGIIDRLEKKRLVKRRFDKTDRRKVLVVPITASAERLFGDASALIQRKVLKLMNRYSPEELAVIRKYFTGAIEVLQEITHEIKTKK